MPDITMCENKNCTLRKSCFRFTAIPTKVQQSYCNFVQDEYDYCEYFMDNGSNLMKIEKIKNLEISKTRYRKDISKIKIIKYDK
jgi:hypothetical protein